MKKYSEVFSKFKNETSKINNNLIEKYKDMNESPDFEQDCYSTGIFNIGHDSIQFRK